MFGYKARFCGDQGKVVVRDCSVVGAEYTCQKLKDYNMVDCVRPCDSQTFVEYTSCEGKVPTIHTCDESTTGSSYEFVYTDDACPIACLDGECVETTPAVAGDPCDASTYASSCYGKEMYTCESGKIVVTMCTGDTVCAKQHGAAAPHCVSSCKPGSDTYACATENGKQVTNNQVCRVATDRKYYLFDEREVCQSTCLDGVCDRGKLPDEDSACNNETFEEFCAHNTAYYCNYITQTVVTYACSGSMPLCRMNKKGTFADCVIPCEKGSETIYNCDSRNEDGRKVYYTDNFECQEGADGAYYYFNAQNDCAGECKDGKCL